MVATDQFLGVYLFLHRILGLWIPGLRLAGKFREGA